MTHRPVESPRPSPGVPLWMRKGTLWVILVLTTATFALIAYYLLPLWWARLVNVWVGVSNGWATGLLLGFIPVTIGAGAVWGAWKRGSPREEVEQRRFAHYLRPVLSAIAGLSIVVLLLTVFIALGVSEPLREARGLWQHDAPGVLSATLVGGLIGIIAILAGYVIKVRIAGRGPAPREDDADTQDS